MIRFAMSATLVLLACANILSAWSLWHAEQNYQTMKQTAEQCTSALKLVVDVLTPPPP